MPTVGFLVTLTAAPGHEDDVAAFLRDAKVLVDAEPGTKYWFGFQSGPTTFGIFDAFDTEDARQVHLHGEVRKALQAHAAIFDPQPSITPVDLLHVKQFCSTDGSD